jgi:hypothetical protein
MLSNDKGSSYERARKRVEPRLGFYTHLSAYVLVNLFLIVLNLAVNLATSGHYLWFKWPLMGWGIGIFFHALVVFAFPNLSAVKMRMIQREIKRESLR